jgi:tetratricopeptide (TPR) repeat protein
MLKLIHEIHRRSLWQVLGFYLAASWIVLQVIDVLTNNFGLPDWVPAFALVLLLLGLPIVLGTAFIQEGIRGGAPGAAGPGAAPEGQSAQPAATDSATQGAVTSDEAPAPTPATSVADPTAGAGSTHRRLFTWRNALVGGAAAFVLLAALTVGYMAMRTAGVGPAGTLVAKGVLDERATILVADFESTDEMLGRAATEALRIDLSQSTMVRVAEPAFTADALRRMNREPESPLDLALALELAQREGLPAVLTGEINAAGGRFLLSAELVAAGDGQVLVSHREAAADSSEILPAIDELSKRIRERIGESLKTIRAEPPLEAATTPSLEALRKYSLAVQAIDMRAEDARGITLLDEAIALDPGFGMAYRKLGMVFRNRGQERARMVEALTQAFENRDRLTERERYMATAAYHESVTGDMQLTIAAYQNLLEIDPEHTGASNNLGVMYEIVRDFDRAEETYALSARLDTTSQHAYVNLVSARFHQGDASGAGAALEEALARFPDNPAVEWHDYQHAAVIGDYETADSLASDMDETYGTDLFWRAAVAADRGAIAAATGRLEEARTYLRSATTANQDRRLSAEVLRMAEKEAWLDIVVREDRSASVSRVEAALGRYPLEGIDPLERPYLPISQIYAEAGRPEVARRLLEEYESAVPAELRAGVDALSNLERTRGVIALAEGDPSGAIEAFRLSDRGSCYACAYRGLADAYLAAGNRDSALALYTGTGATDPIPPPTSDLRTNGSASCTMKRAISRKPPSTTPSSSDSGRTPTLSYSPG